MTELIKSVLLVDYDSLHRSLSAGDEAAAQRLATRLPAWISAIEAGRLFVEAPEEPQRRRILIRRCYADPSLLGNDRKIFLTNGFQVVDCPPAEGRTHNAAAIHMVLDSIDAIEHPTGYEDFILLSADSDLSPLLIRLRANNRTTSIYTNDVTTESYKSIADAMIAESHFAEVLLSEDEPEDDEEEEALPPQAERSEVEALARRIASATNVPLFAPRTFADLFRQLVEEVTENGYHFQKTAENVATRMADAGRNVSRRQVVFVVKGLALKGHVFSSGDTADRLAEAFREQVLYLAENAGVQLDDDDQRVLSAWIIGSTPPTAPQEKAAAAKTDTTPKNAGKTVPAKPPSPPPSRAARRRQQKSNGAAKPREEAKAATPAPEPAKPAEPPKPLTKPSEMDKPSTPLGRDQAKPAVAEAKPAAASARPSNASETPAATTERSSKDDKPQESAPAAPSVSRTTTTAAPAKPRSPSRDAGKDTEADADTVESSILAAIAEAVDVLVEDSDEADDRRSADRSPTETDTKAKAPAESVEDEDLAEGDDIGDEIQRIIASYNRNRKTGGES